MFPSVEARAVRCEGETSPEGTRMTACGFRLYSERNGIHEERALCFLLSVRKATFTGRQERLVGERSLSNW